MRISTGMIFDAGLGGMQKNTSTLLRTQQQISSGRRILTPSDDPVAAASAMEVTQSQGINKQYESAHDYAKNTLGLMDGQLSSSTDLLVRIRELTVQGGNGALSAADRKSIAAELRSRFDELIGLGNSTDGTGQYLFSGYQGSNKPFAGSVENGVGYAGDDGQRTLRVAGSRNLPISDSGNNIFMRIKNGNGIFATGIQGAKSINEHTASIDTGTVSNGTLWGAPANPANVELRFWVDAAGGGVATKGYAAGNVSLANVSVATPVTIDSLGLPPNNQFNISLDGGATTVPVTVADNIYTTPAALAGAVQNGIDAALGVASPAAGSATVTLDAAGNMVVTSNTLPIGSGSSVTLSAVGGNTGLAGLFGAPAQTNGLTSIPGQTFYDLVDKATGNSLFGGASTAAAGGTYTHLYTSGASIPISSSGPAGTTVFDLGARVSVTGVPTSGDAFAIDRVNGSLATSPATITHTNAVIDKGVVTDPIKWTSTANTQDMEVRFWTDTVGGTTTAGTATGSIDLTTLGYPFTFTAGTDDKFQIALNGNAAVTATVTSLGPHANAAAAAAAVQSAVDTALGAGKATVGLNAANRVVVTSNAVGAGSSIAVSATGGNSGYATLFDSGGGVATVAGASTGGVQAPGYAVAATPVSYPITIAAPNNQFNFALNLSSTVAVTVTPGAYATPAALATAVQSAIDATALGPGAATVGLDASNRLVVTSALNGPTSSVTLSALGGTGLTAMFGGVPTSTVGTISVAGAVYYDLVDAGTGKSLYSGAPSVTGAGGTYTHPYASVHGTLSGAVDLSVAANRTIVTGVNDTLDLTVDGIKRSITLTGAAGPGGLVYGSPALLAAQVQTQLDSAIPPIGVTAGLDATGKFLVLTSNSVTGSSAVAITAPASTGAAALLGAATPSSSLQYGSSATINFKGATFDYGASVTITGNPVGNPAHGNPYGDTYTIKGSTDPALGNGFFITAAKTATAANMGGGIIGTGEVLDQAKWNSVFNSRQLEVRFWKDPKDTSASAPVYYDLVDAKTEKSLFTDSTSTSGGGGNTFTHVFKSGDPIAFSGLAAPYNDFGVTATINGTPTSGDVFTLQSSVSQSIFETVGNLIHALESPVGPVGSNSNAELQNKLGFALTSIVAAGDNIDRVRADIGTRLAEVDDLSSVSQNLDLQYSSTLSTLQDVDYAKAITDLTRMQAQLQAAQQSFVKVSQLSLFNYL